MRGSHRPGSVGPHAAIRRARVEVARDVPFFGRFRHLPQDGQSQPLPWHLQPEALKVSPCVLCVRVLHVLRLRLVVLLLAHKREDESVAFVRGDNMCAAPGVPACMRASGCTRERRSIRCLFLAHPRRRGVGVQMPRVFRFTHLCILT
jgi:hypothetical protein